jgi:hypothetical protein
MSREYVLQRQHEPKRPIPLLDRYRDKDGQRPKLPHLTFSLYFTICDEMLSSTPLYPQGNNLVLYKNLIQVKEYLKWAQ